MGVGVGDEGGATQMHPGTSLGLPQRGAADNDAK